MSGLNPDAVAVAMKRSGLRADQIERAIADYREAAASMGGSPEWTAIYHVSGKKNAWAQFGAEGTAIVMHVESWKARDEWHQDAPVFLFGEKSFEFFSEARAAEMQQGAKPRPYEFRAPIGGEP